MLLSLCLHFCIPHAQAQKMVETMAEAFEVTFKNMEKRKEQHEVSVTYIEAKRRGKKYDPARIRTWNPLIRSQMPYPLGHRAGLKSSSFPHQIARRETQSVAHVYVFMRIPRITGAYGCSCS